MAGGNEITFESIGQAIHAAGLSGRPVCVHSALKSFGRIAGGPAAIIDALLAEGCTLVGPMFSDHLFMLKSQPGMRPARNAWPYGSDWDPDVTHCANANCERCRDAVARGPIL